MRHLRRRGLLVVTAACLAGAPRAASADEVRPPTWSTALFAEASTAFIPHANDVPLMLSAGVRLAGIHELWLRGGFMPTGDDRNLGFGALGYRVVLRPGRVVRPLFGALAAALPETCSHDAAGPVCTKTPIFIFSATGGLRIEPAPWLGINTSLALGLDSYPNPFGMVELGVSFALPLS
jgi:hypothetical protein